MIRMHPMTFVGTLMIAGVTGVALGKHNWAAFVAGLVLLVLALWANAMVQHRLDQLTKPGSAE